MDSTWADMSLTFLFYVHHRADANAYHSSPRSQSIQLFWGYVGEFGINTCDSHSAPTRLSIKHACSQTHIAVFVTLIDSD